MAGALFLAAKSLAQVSGTVVDAVSKEKISGATVQLENTFLAAETDGEGKFSFPDVNAKSVRLKVSHIGFESMITESPVPSAQVEIQLVQKTYISGEAVVTATRASDKSPTAFTMVSKSDLEKNNLGQDVPFLLNTTPSVVVTSDAGNGVGYTGIRIRGSDATRVNVTINGIPVNDAEENGMYWVDLPDFASSVDNIQIQRGIGTSTNGAGAFGGSVNILSTTLSPQPFATIDESYGSFNTWKNTLNFGTGLLKNKIAFEGRLSKIVSDGFIDRSAADLKSFYLSGGYYGKKSTLRAIIFSGREKTYQAWNGIPEAKLNNDFDALVTHYYNNTGYSGALYNTAGDSVNLFSSNNRTYNVFTYKNQTDNYQQDYFQLHYSFAASQHWKLNAAVHYTKGRGYYEEYKYNQSLGEYKLSDVIIGTDTITSTDLIRQKWLDNDFFGFTFSSDYETDKLEFTIGGAANQYTGRHFDRVIWAEYASNGEKDYIYNDNDAVKNDFNVFVKAIYSLTGKLHLFGDVQYRAIDYSFLGFNEISLRERQHVSYGFFNPKAGIAYMPGKLNKLYASVAIGHHEPIRKDFTETSTASRPKPEEMYDVEGGYIFSGSRLHVGTNIYFMRYKNQLVLTGKVNDVGEYTRQNVPVSVRAGAEIELAWHILKTVSLGGNVTISRNKIREFREYIDDYDAGIQQQKVYENTDISLSPNIISSAVISWLPVKNLSLDFISKYVGKQFLDNTSNEPRKLDPYYLNDVLLQYRFSVSVFKEIALKLAVYNLFDIEYESNGYTYGYFSGGSLIQENFYYPQAGTNWMGGISLKF